MKRKCTYILIGLLCFLGFSGEVNADSKEICVYKKTHSVENQYHCSEAITTITISYDESKNLKYNIKYNRTCSDESSDRKNTSAESAFEDWDASGEAQKNWKYFGGLGGQLGYFYDEMSGTNCPKNVLFKKANKDYICFYNDNTGKKWCEDHATNYSASRYDTAQKTDVKLGKYDNIKNPVCNRSKGLEGNDGSENTMCYMRFEYDKTNDKLLISSSTKDPAQDSSVLKTISDSDDHFTCGSYTVGQGGNALFVHRNVYLVNSNAGLASKGVVITTRSEFDKKFLEEWNKTGECPAFDIDSGGASNGNVKSDFYLLLPDAIQDCKENGCSRVDVDGFGSLRDWKYDWSSWTEIKSSYDNCEGLLGENLIALINDVLLYVKILIPVALIAFGLIDFVKAVFSSKEDDMKKAQVRFIKRLIMAVIVFIVPSIINLLMTAVDGIWAHINNSACNIWK